MIELDKSTVSEIVEFLNKCKNYYFNYEESMISDEEFDAIENHLNQLDPSNSYFEKVGSSVMKNDKIQLPVIMGSLNQVHDESELKSFLKRIPSESQIVLSEKLDGCSVLLEYQYGKFTKAYSRGDGEYGKDITRHVQNIPSFPKELIDSSNFFVRAEIIIPKKDFDELNSNYAESKQYKNLRNYVSGSINRKEIDPIFSQYARVVAYSLISKVVSFSKVDQFCILKRNGFDISENFSTIVENCNIEFLKAIAKKFIKNSNYQLDGIVVDVNDENIATSLEAKKESSTLNPASAFKFKLNGNEYKSIIEEVQWNVSKWGFLKPKIKIDPVDVDGVTITYLTAFNAKFVNDNGVGKGAEISFVRAGDVIPHIKEVIKKVEPDMPSVEYVWNETGVDIILENPESSEQMKFLSTLSFFKEMEISNLGEGNLQKMFEEGFDSIEKVIKSSKEEFEQILGKNGEKVYKSMKKMLMPTTLGKLAGSTNFFGRGIGVTTMQRVFEKYENVKDISLSGLLSIDGIEEKTANSIISGVSSFTEFLNDIDGYYSIQKSLKKFDGKFAGQSIVFTGFRDSELENIVKIEGGEIKSSVSKKTNLLVVEDPKTNSTKAQKARELGVQIVDLETFNKMIKNS